jgi:hypothetical protein
MRFLQASQLSRQARFFQYRWQPVSVGEPLSGCPVANWSTNPPTPMNINIAELERAGEEISPSRFATLVWMERRVERRMEKWRTNHDRWAGEQRARPRPEVRRCGAWARSRGRPCQRPAMANGRCKSHGGPCRGPTSALGKLIALQNLKQYRRKPTSSHPA